MDALRDLSEALANVVATNAPSVVRVEGRRRRAGTGVAWSEEGVIVTADHVLDREDGVSIGLADGGLSAAVVTGRDPSTDLAVLKIEGASPRPAVWTDLQDARVGHVVLALGRPGQTLRARMGIIGTLGEGWRFPGGGEIDRYVESDVGVVPGFSGGPLVDVGGRVLGINTAAMPGRRTITIPTGTVRRVVPSLLAHGRIPRGYLGVGVQPVNLPAGLQQELRQDSALLVTSVEPGSPAERAGLLMGDTLTRVDDRPVGSPLELLNMLTGERIGVSVPLRIVRAGQTRDAVVVVGERGLKTA